MKKETVLGNGEIQGLRRSSRRRKNRNEKEIKVSSTNTLLELKVEVIFYSTLMENIFLLKFNKPFREKIGEITKSASLFICLTKYFNHIYSKMN